MFHDCVSSHSSFILMSYEGEALGGGSAGLLIGSIFGPILAITGFLLGFIITQVAVEIILERTIPEKYD